MLAMMVIGPRLTGLDGAFDEVERHEVVAMDPAPEAPAHLSVWRRRP